MRRGLRAWEPHRSRRRARGDARARLDGRLRRHGPRERSGCGEHDDDARSNAGRRRGARAIEAPWRTVGILLLYTSPSRVSTRAIEAPWRTVGILLLYTSPSRVSTRAIGIVADVDVDVWANSRVRVGVWANSLVRVGVWANSLVRVGEQSRACGPSSTPPWTSLRDRAPRTRARVASTAGDRGALRGADDATRRRAARRARCGAQSGGSSRAIARRE